MEERTFLDTGHVKVTSARVVVGSQTYAMAAVNSVKVDRKDVSPSVVIPGLMVGVGGLWLLARILSATTDLVAYVYPLLVGGAGVLWIWNTKDVFEYRLILTTSSGEVSILGSRNEPDVRAVEKAVTDAIIHRG